MPGDNSHEIRHEGRNRAFENSGVSADYIFIVDLRFVLLLYNCNIGMIAKFKLLYAITVRKGSNNGGNKQMSDRLTVVVSREEVFFLIGMPGDNFDKVGDEGRNLTLQNYTVPQDYVFLVDICIVILGDH